MGRPLKDFEGFVGQTTVVRAVERLLVGSVRGDRPAPHLLFVGPPGGGKTALGKAVAKACGTKIHVVPSTKITVKGSATLLCSIGRRDIVFIDEAHKLRDDVVMTLNTAVDDHRVPDPEDSTGVVMGDIPEFTLIIATNRPGELNKAFRSRFLEIQLEEYTLREKTEIARRVASGLGISMTGQAARRLAEHAESPRDIQKWVSALATCFSGVAEIVQPLVEQFLHEVIGLDEHGLTSRHRRYVLALARHGGHPKTQRTLVVEVGCDLSTLADEVEPLLVRRGFVDFGERGRVLTPTGGALARVLQGASVIDDDEPDTDPTDGGGAL